MSNASSTKKAQDLADAVKNLANASSKIALQKRLGQAAVAQAQLGVRQGRDPYGNAWKPLTSRVGRPLRRTGNNIQRSWTAGAETPDTFKFGSRFKYLATHQYGATIKPVRKPWLVFRMEVTGRKLNRMRMVKIPRRQLVPEQDTGGLGAKWLAAFSRVTRRFILEVIPGGN